MNKKIQHNSMKEQKNLSLLDMENVSVKGIQIKRVRMLNELIKD